jgi:ATP-dependent Clp protease ATP-binding subunit ClpA
VTTSDRYSQHAQRALTFAESYAHRLRYGLVDTDHILLGILSEPDCLGALALRDLALDLAALEAELLRQRADHPPAPQDEQLPYTDALNNALSLAFDQADWLGQHYVGTEHILLGLMQQPGGRAVALLSAFAITPDQVHRAVRRLSQAGYIEVSLEEVRRMARFTEMARRILNGAEAEARRREHPYVAIEHVLPTLLRDQRTLAGRVMREFNADPALLETLLDEATELSPLDEALSMAVALAIGMGDHYTGSDHLLLAIASHVRGSWVLAAIGMRPDLVQRRLRQLMNEARR